MLVPFAVDSSFHRSFNRLQRPLMKTFAGIACLILLALHMFGLSMAVFCLDFNYQVAETGGAGHQYVVKTFKARSLNMPVLPDSGATEGLYRIDDQLYNVTSQVYQHDTLFVTYQTNESAWQHFTVLSEIMQEVYAAKQNSHPIGIAVRLVTDFSKIYLPVNHFRLDDLLKNMQLLGLIIFGHTQFIAEQDVLLPDSPPPEMSEYSWRVFNV